MGCVRANAGQGWRMDSSGRLSRLLNGSGGTCEREGAGGARPRGAVGRRESAHRTAGVVRAGRVPRVAGVAGIKACSLRRPSGVQSGGASARDPRRPTGKPRANPGKPRALIGLTKQGISNKAYHRNFSFVLAPASRSAGLQPVFACRLSFDSGALSVGVASRGRGSERPPSDACRMDGWSPAAGD